MPPPPCVHDVECHQSSSAPVDAPTPLRGKRSTPKATPAVRQQPGTQRCLKGGHSRGPAETDRSRSPRVCADSAATPFPVRRTWAAWGRVPCRPGREHAGSYLRGGGLMRPCASPPPRADLPRQRHQRDRQRDARADLIWPVRDTPAYEPPRDPPQLQAQRTRRTPTVPGVVGPRGRTPPPPVPTPATRSRPPRPRRRAPPHPLRRHRDHRFPDAHPRRRRGGGRFDRAPRCEQHIGLLCRRRRPRRRRRGTPPAQQPGQRQIRGQFAPRIEHRFPRGGHIARAGHLVPERIPRRAPPHLDPIPGLPQRRLERGHIPCCDRRTPHRPYQLRPCRHPTLPGRFLRSPRDAPFRRAVRRRVTVNPSRRSTARAASRNRG